MKNAIKRYTLALIFTTLFNWWFIKITTNLEFIVEPRKVKGIVSISLIRKEISTLEVKKEQGEPARFEKQPKKKTKIESKKAAKKIPGEKERKIPGGIKPLEGNLPAFYIEKIKTIISNSIFYPVESINIGEEGIVTVKFQLRKDGSVIYCMPQEKKFMYLEEAACISINKSKFPPFPENIRNQKITFIVEIEYNLESLSWQEK